MNLQFVDAYAQSGNVSFTSQAGNEMRKIDGVVVDANVPQVPACVLQSL